MDRTPEKLLIVDLSLLGDLLMTTPVLRSIANAWPDCRMSYLSRPHTSVVLEHNPLLEKVLTFESRRITPGSYLRALSEIRREKFDAALLIHRSFNSALLTFLAGIPCRIGYASEGRGLLLTDPMEERKEGHLVDRALRLLEPLGVSPSSRELEFFPAPGSRDTMRERAARQRIDIERPLLVLNPAGSWPTKRWMARGFAEVGSHFADGYGYGWDVVVVGGPDDAEIAGQVTSLANGKIANLQGELSFDELYELLKAANLFITNDSGPMHLGVAAKVPIVAIFGPTNPEICGPISDNSTVVRGEIDCLCCYLKDCDHLSCMTSLKPEAVINAAETLLEHGSKQPNS
jgi:heptosyltransferase-2